MSKPKLLFDGIENKHYVRAWKEGRDFAVQVWKGKKPEGEPAGDWLMPGVLGLDVCIAQAILQTKPLS